MKKYILRFSLVCLLIALTTSCSEDDATGASTVTPSNPSLSVSLDFANTQTLVEEETTYGFTVTLSEPQVVDVRVYLNQVGGDATNGDDFTIPAFVTIPAGSTSASDVIEIHSDALVEETETAVIEIASGFESNINGISGQTVTFNIGNLVEGDLMIGLMWDTAVFDVDGTEFDPTELADLRLLITDVPYTTIIDGEDGASFESYTLTGDSPDGEYYVVADWYSAFDLGAQGAFGVDLTATFDQVGVINDLTYNFPDALNSASACSAYFILAKITKTGESYEIAEVGQASPAAEPFIGTATVVADDWADYAIGDSITIEADPDDPNQFFIRSYTNPYITNTATAYMIVSVDPSTGAASVMSNEAFDYGCSDGTVSGSGNVNPCTGTIDLTLTFNLGNCGTYSGNSFILQL